MNRPPSFLEILLWLVDHAVEIVLVILAFGIFYALIDLTTSGVFP